MSIVKYLAMALGLIVAAVGILGIAAPSVLLEFGRSLQTTNALYIVAAVRVMFGAMLFLVAPVSRAPKILRVLGAFIIIAGVFTPFLGFERSRAMFDWWSTQGPFFTRAWAIVAVAFGLFIVYAVTSPRRSAA
jgi:uncharacterized membrane protein YidH (DUF202 family)